MTRGKCVKFDEQVPTLAPTAAPTTAEGARRHAAANLAELSAIRTFA